MILPAASAAARQRALALLLAGEVVALPTDTVYGLAVAASVCGSTERLFVAKARPVEVALPVLVAGTEEALELMEPPAPPARELLERWWPGPLTIVVRRAPASGSFELGGDESTIGLRCPDHDFVRELAREAGPLAVTSANLHGQATPGTAQGVAEALAGRVSLVMDGGTCDGAASTVVDLTGSEPRLLREGRVPWDDVVAALVQ